jgi:uncharacterized protein YbjQ (UPF0145 family)
VTTSDLTIDETILLETIGWEAREMVSGAAVYSIPKGFWSIGKGESTPATLAYERAVHHAAEEVSLECRRFHGHGVAGVHIETEVTKHYVEATIVGTAIGPGSGKSNRSSVFVSDLSVSEFVLLRRAGWQTVGLVFGASFVFVPRRKPVRVLAQSGENVELTNFTQALYASRSTAMERMQAQALKLKAAGVVGVRLSEGTLAFAGHAMRFAAIGTAVRPIDGHNGRLNPTLAVSLDDAEQAVPKLI